MLINGKWVTAASGKTFQTVNPATGSVMAEVAEGDREDINRAVSAARTAFDGGPWRRMTPSERGRAIWKLADLIGQYTEEFALLETLDNGKPLTISLAADVPLAVDLFRYMAGWATKVEGQTIPISVPYTPGAKYLAYTLSKTRILSRRSQGRPARSFSIMANAAEPDRGFTSSKAYLTRLQKGWRSKRRKSKSDRVWIRRRKWDHSFPMNN
jgi:hypothetical protein